MTVRPTTPIAFSSRAARPTQDRFFSLQHLRGQVDLDDGQSRLLQWSAQCHCALMRLNVSNLFRHMAARHPLDEISVEGYPGYYKCPECQQYMKGVVPSQRHLSSMSCARGKNAGRGKTLRKQWRSN